MVLHKLIFLVKKTIFFIFIPHPEAISFFNTNSRNFCFSWHIRYKCGQVIYHPRNTCNSFLLFGFSTLKITITFYFEIVIPCSDISCCRYLIFFTAKRVFFFLNFVLLSLASFNNFSNLSLCSSIFLPKFNTSPAYLNYLISRVWYLYLWNNVSTVHSFELCYRHNGILRSSELASRTYNLSGIFNFW